MINSQSLHVRSGGPYPSRIAGSGGVPNLTTDVPICAVFLVLYLGFAIKNGMIFRANHRKKHKFNLLIILYGFCLSRIVTLVLRIAWATKLHNARLAIAAGVFANVGVLLVYIVNLILAQRILRAKQPHLGWHPVARVLYKVLYAALIAALVMVISSIVITNYTLNMKTRLTCRDIQLAAITFLLVFAVLPVIHIAIAFLLPKSDVEERFGVGTTKIKILVLGLSTGLSVLDAGFKTGTSWMPPRPVTHPAWYQSKACFYTFNFGLEILILCILTRGRIDQRFWVPDGCKKAGDYSRLLEGNPIQEEAIKSNLETSK